MKSTEPVPIAAFPVEENVQAIPVPIVVVSAEPYAEASAPPPFQPTVENPNQSLNPPIENIGPLSFEVKPIPDYFMKCPALCCAINLSYCPTFLDWFGSAGNCVCCCIEGEEFSMKAIKNHQKTSCILNSRDVELIGCSDAFKCYRQFFCCECVCSCPFDGTYRITNVIFRDIPDRFEIAPTNNNIIFQ